MSFSRWQGPDRPVSNGSVVVRTRLSADNGAPARARAALAPLRGEISDDVLARAVLLTSEVVSNAVRHSGGDEVRLDVWRSGGTVAVVASDDGAGFEPVAARREIGVAEGGLGLPLLDMLSDAWGSGTEADSWVWFECCPRPTSVPAVKRATAGDELLDIRMAVESFKNHALLTLDNLGNVTNWGAGPVAMTGFTAEQMLGHHVSELFVHLSKGRFARDREVAESTGWHRSERWIRRSDESQLWAEVDLAPIRDRVSHQRGLSMLISDITARKRTSDEREHLIVDLREQALTDEVTGLANRRRWMNELQRELARSRRHETPLAIAMLDLDRFKEYNDTHGHPAGDDLLRSVARSWSDALRASDLLARYGGDEFAITLPDCSPALALTVVGRVQAATPEITACAGIAYAAVGDSAQRIVERVDAALYDAKRRGPGLRVMAALAEEKS